MALCRALSDCCLVILYFRPVRGPRQNTVHTYRVCACAWIHHRPLSTPEQVLGVESRARATLVVDCGDDDDDHDVHEDIAALLPVLDARYTLIYRGLTSGTTPSSGGSDGGGSLRETEDSSVTNVSGGGGGDSGDGSRKCGSDGERIAPVGVLPGGLELRLVEDSGRKCLLKDRGRDEDANGNGRSMTKWLLEHATAILLDALPSPAVT